MKKDLKERIYRAQCYGNVEPIEYMVPYPNLGAIVDGMIIKHPDKPLFGDLDWTRMDFHRRVKQTANWLASRGVKPKDRVLMSRMPFPDAETLAFAIWSMGASLVVADLSESVAAIEHTKPALILSDSPFPDCLNNQSDEFTSNYLPLLEDEAMVTWKAGKGIRLSHYNILVNASGVEKALELDDQMTLYCNLKSCSPQGIVLQCVLPLYFGGTFTSKVPDMNLTEDFTFATNIKEHDLANPNDIVILPENTAVLSIGPEPIHMTRYQIHDGILKVNGHSVMMGYTDDTLNKQVFTGDSLYLQLNQ